MGKKKETDYKLLYHELLEKSDEVFNENDLLKEENDAAKKEIATLKQTIGGYITQATKTKKELANLKADYELAKKSVNDLTKVSLENKAMVKECITREQEMEEKHKEELLALTHQIGKLTSSLEEQKKQKEEAERTMLFYKENYNYLKNLPWYKRIFAK